MQTSYDKENAVYGGFFSRLAAFLIDNIVISGLLFFIKFAVWIVKLSVGADAVIFKPLLFEYDFFAILYYLITVSYFIIATYFCGTTVGKHLMKLKVVDVNGEKMTFISVVIRETVGRYLSALIVYVGYFMIGLDTRKQALHDKISDTCVIYTHKFPVNKPVQRVAAPVARPVQTMKPAPIPNPMPVPGSTPAPRPEAAPKQEVAPRPEGVSNPEAAPKPESVSNPEATPRPETVSNPEAAPRPESVSNPEVAPKPETVINAEAAPGPETVSNPEVASKPETVSNPEAAPKSVSEQALPPEPAKKESNYSEEMWKYF